MGTPETSPRATLGFRLGEAVVEHLDYLAIGGRLPSRILMHPQAASWYRTYVEQSDRLRRADGGELPLAYAGRPIVEDASVGIDEVR